MHFLHTRGWASQATDVGGEKLRQSFNDLYSVTNSGFQFATVVRFKRIMASADLTWAELGYVNSDALLDLEVKIIQNIFDLKAGYLIVLQNEMKDNEVIRGWSMELNAGGKYWKNDVTVDYSIKYNGNVLDQGGFEEPQEWWDPMVGMKLKFVLNRAVWLGVNMNYGGFGISNASDQSWDFSYINGFKVMKYMTINAGYRSFGYSRTDGDPGAEVHQKVHAFGPLLGVSLIL